MARDDTQQAVAEWLGLAAGAQAKPSPAERPQASRQHGIDVDAKKVEPGAP